jgi:ABC-type Na+ efflux pump permease subunit
MTIYFVLGYLLISVATAMVCMDTNKTRNPNELIASFIFGLLWPLVFAIRIVAKILL